MLELIIRAEPNELAFRIFGIFIQLVVVGGFLFRAYSLLVKRKREKRIRKTIEQFLK